MPMNARDVALLDLDAIRLPGWRGGAVGGGASTLEGDLEPRDRALAEQIRIGVIKNLLLLQHLIAHHSGRSLKSIDERVQKILAIGLYQLRFLSRVPPSAAVDQAVEQTRRFGQPRAAGFVNAVLRNAIRNPDPPMPPEVELSHPPMLMRRLRELLGGDEARVLQFARHDNREPTTIVRLMSGATVDSLRATTTDDAVRLVPHEQSGMVVVQGSKRALLADWSRRGLAQVQDPTSASIVDHLDLRPGQRVLDRCAGLGTKTIQIVERIGPAGSVLAVDPNHHRIQGLQRLLDERGIGNVHVREVAFLGGECIDPYDRILVDAPCSNSGVLPRRAEARYAQDDRSLASLRQLQLDILNDTIPHLSPGGSLVYSTCSVWPEENEDLVSTFLSAHLQIRLIVQQSVLPSLDSDDPTRYHDGGYFAVLSRHD